MKGTRAIKNEIGMDRDINETRWGKVTMGREVARGGGVKGEKVENEMRGEMNVEEG